ncbi:hypothetical protein VKT23_002518 [Stygiomarasmius scandens]|uniref:Uncharacterized protein n=1 Tax=Marasmiellus scandens TaxID=2682957 RepID=A0ABR1K287_9AGAR
MQHFSDVDSAKDDLAAQLRFESFRMGKPLPPSKSMPLKHSHARSHSRNASVSSLSFSSSTNSYDMSSSTTNSMSSISSSKRNSHHRRRSSVSTRTESAELMGVVLPDFPEDNSQGEKDSIRRRALWALEGKPEKVEIPELSSTPEIEKKIFEFPTKPSFPPGSGAFGGGLSNLMGSKRDSFKLLGPSASSKDQLGTLVEEEEEDEWDCQKSPDTSSITPDPLTPVSPDDSAMKVAPVARPRPVGLNLRPLSLTPETLVTTTHGLPTPSLTPSPRSGLRSLSLTPSSISSEESMSNNTPTPAPRGRLGLSIQTSSSSDVSMATDEDKKSKPIRRSSISYKRSSSSGLPTPEMTPTLPERRFPTLNHHTSVSSVGTSSSEEDFYSTSNSHASYHRHRPLSASEQHFLFKSHNALLSRIQDLEKALSVRRESISSYGSRPVSTISVPDSEASSEPSDEMLRLVADLKAERDELKRDVDGWRVRVGDLEKQIGVLGKRVDNERREAWVARSRVSVLEAEKGALEKEVQVVQAKKGVLADEKVELEAEVKELTSVVEHLQEGKRELETENDQLKDEIERLRQQLRQDVDVLSTPTPKSFEYQQTQATHAWKRALSLDTEDSATDVDVNLSFDGGHHFGFSLKSVDEEAEDLDAPQVPEDQEDDVYDDESEDGLAGYEDEEDSDLSFQSPGSSSFGSEDEFHSRPRSVSHLAAADVPVSPITPVSPSDVAPSRHRAQASLSKWTFPRGAQSSLAPQPSETRSSRDEVDKFFGCLEDGDSASDSSSRPVSPSAYSYENSKGLFVNAMGQFGDDEFIPFALPPGVGIVEEPKGLEVVIEEDEDFDEEEDFDEGSTKVEDDDNDDIDEMFAGGIKITFTPPTEDLDVIIADALDVDVPEKVEEEEEEEQEEDVPAPQWTVPISREPVPIFEESDEEEDDVPFFFGRPAPSAPEAVSTPPSNKQVPSVFSPPSSIPKPTITKSWSFPESPASPLSPESSTSSPVMNYSAFVTPPTKRGGTMPSFIPQPMSSPSPVRRAPIVRSKSALSSSTTTTFIRQPSRKPLMAAAPARPSTESGNSTSSITNGSTTFTSSTTTSTNNYTPPSPGLQGTPRLASRLPLPRIHVSPLQRRTTC